MKISKSLLPAAALVALFAGCQDEDMGFTSQDVKNAKYDQEFIKAFGNVDPDHNWAMATSVKANVSATCGRDAIALIYTDKAVYAGSELLGLVDLKKGNVADLNIPSGMEQVYVLLVENGKTLVSGYFDVVNGQINIANEADSQSKRATAGTRAEGDGNGVTKGTVMEDYIIAEDATVKKYSYNGNLYTLEELRAYANELAAKGERTPSNYAPFKDDCLVPEHYDFENAEINDEVIYTITKDGYLIATSAWVDGVQVYDINVYTRDELIQKSKDEEGDNARNYSNYFTGITWDEENACCDYTNAEVKSNYPEVINGGYYMKAWPNPVFKNAKEMQDWTKDNNKYNNGPYKNCYFPASVDFTDATVDESQAPLVAAPLGINITYLNGVDKKAAEPWTLAEGKKLYGPLGFFQEQVNYYGGSAGQIHNTVTKPELPGYDLAKVEAGFSITSTGKNDGEIRLPFIYGATQIQDQFGYVYWRDGQDPLTQPHYVLMSDGRPQSNIYFNSWKGTAVGEMQLSTWDLSLDSDKMLTTTDAGGDTEIYGTEYKLTYFGDNHDQNGTYKFPAGVHIMFFVLPCQMNDDGTINYNKQNDFNYSLPEYNKRIKHYNWSGTTDPTKPEGTEDMNAGARKATAWMYNGQVYMGFEDGGRDEDLNDIVFWVEGEFTTGDIIEAFDVTEDSDQEWIFACEDLGGDFDYDFNDVVWRTSQHITVTTETETTNGEVSGTKVTYTIEDVKVELMANGGTMPVQLLYNNEVLSKDNKTELHEILSGQTIDEETKLYKAVNAGAEKGIDGVSPALIHTIAADGKILKIEDLSENFKVQVIDGASSIYVTAPNKTKGDVIPQVIILPGEWEWPTEHTGINEAYPEFTDWARTSTWTQWSEVKVEGKTVSR